jgi:CO/xanthine dehydrogenase FAD-binding subunit
MGANYRNGMDLGQGFTWACLDVVTCPEAAKALVGERLTLKTLQQAAVMVRQTVSPISDLRADAAYRRALAGNLLLRLLAVGR